MVKKIVLAAVTALTLAGAAAPAMAQPPGYYRWHHWHHYGYGPGPGWGPGPGYWHHRHWCRWHPYRCGW